MLYTELDDKKAILNEQHSQHFETIIFLRQCSHDSHIIPSRTLANRIERSILTPIQSALEIIEKIEQISLDKVPKVIFNRWTEAIDNAIIMGGYFDEL